MIVIKNQKTALSMNVRDCPATKYPLLVFDVLLMLSYKPTDDQSFLSNTLFTWKLNVVRV